MAVGMLVSRHRVAAIIVRGRDVAWEATVVPDGEDITATVTQVLERLPRQAWWGRVRVRVAIDDPLSVVKTVRGLPPVRNIRSLERVLATAPGRFFVLPGRTPVVTGIRVIAPGVVRAAAFDAQLVDAIRSGAGAARVTVTAIIPAAVAVGVLSAREREHPLAAAIGVTMLSRREPIAVRGPQRRPRTGPVSTTRIAAAGIVAASSAAGAAVLPGHTDGRTATPLLRPEVRATRADALATSSNADGASRVLASVSSFERGRTSMTLLVDALAEVLPERASIVSFRAGSGGVAITVLASRAMTVVRALERALGVSAIETSGPIVRDAAGAGSDRVTLHFRVPSDPSDARTVFVARGAVGTTMARDSRDRFAQGYQMLRSALINGRSHAEVTTTLAALLTDVGERTGVRVGALELGSDSTGLGHLLRLTVRGDATGDVGALAHFVAGLESSTTLLAVRELALTPNTPATATSDPNTVRAEFALEALATIDPPSANP